MDLPDRIDCIVGHGELRSASRDSALDGEFEIAHSFCPTRMLIVNFIPSDPRRSQFPLTTDTEYFLSGNTRDAKPISASRLWPTGTLKNEFHANWVAVGAADDVFASEFTFQIPNFEFTGTEWSEYSLPGGGLRRELDKFHLLLTPHLPGSPLQIQFLQVDKYHDILSVLKRTRANAFTAILKVSAEDRRPLQCASVANFADELLWLTAFAVGRAIPWLSYDATSEGTTVRFFRRWALLHPYRSPNGCIDLVAPGDLREFLQTAFPVFADLLSKHRRNLIEAIAAYAAALQLPPFPTPIWLTARAFEALMQAFLAEEQRHYPLSDVDRAREELKTAILDICRPRLPRNQKITEEFCNAVGGKVENVLRRSLRDQIEELLTNHDVPHDSTRVRDFVKERHGAAHWGEIKEFTRTYDAWLGGMSLLECLILKLLNYQGMYLDRTQQCAEERKQRLPWIKSN